MQNIHLSLIKIVKCCLIFFLLSKTWNKKKGNCGGGVLTDVVSFACSIYRRVVPYIKIPTTLLGIVDASIGIKTSINHFSRRNRIGSYSFPTAIIIDPSLMSTLPLSEISNGLAEIIKLAIIKDSKLFEILE